MSQLIRVQTVAGAGADFDGLAGSGLFLFSVPRLPRDHGINCNQLGIFGLAVTATWVAAYFEPPSLTGKPILVGSASGASLVAPDGNLAVKFCPGLVPRSSGDAFWLLKVYSNGLTGPTTATLAYCIGER